MAAESAASRSHKPHTLSHALAKSRDSSATGPVQILSCLCMHMHQGHSSQQHSVHQLILHRGKLLGCLRLHEALLLAQPAGKAGCACRGAPGLPGTCGAAACFPLPAEHVLGVQNVRHLHAGTPEIELPLAVLRQRSHMRQATSSSKPQELVGSASPFTPILSCQ